MWTLYVMETSALKEEAVYKKAISYVDRARAARLDSMRQESSKVQSLAAGLLLSFAMENYLSGKAGQGTYQVSVAQVLAELENKDILKISQYSIAKTELGKPYFADCTDIHFNLSHSGDYAVCAMADKEIGVDIQQWKKITNSGIIRRLLNEKETDAYERLSDVEKEKHLFTLWAVKEAYVKYIGAGLSKDLRALYVDFVAGNVVDEETGNACEFFCKDVFAKYAIAVCKAGE